MMISPEAFAETCLKNLTKDELRKVINRIRKQIETLKVKIEAPDYRAVICPDEFTQLACNRLYLASAIKLFEEAGGRYRPSKIEKADLLFERRIHKIRRIELEFFGLHKISKFSYEVEDDALVLKEFSDSNMLKSKDGQYDYSVKRSKFEKELQYIHVGEWRDEYDGFDYGWCILDGTQWTLTFSYDDGSKIEKTGSNIYPYNFFSLMKLLHIKWNDKQN